MLPASTQVNPALQFNLIVVLSIVLAEVTPVLAAVDWRVFALFVIEDIPSIHRVTSPTRWYPRRTMRICELARRFTHRWQVYSVRGTVCRWICHRSRRAGTTWQVAAPRRCDTNFASASYPDRVGVRDRFAGNTLHVCAYVLL